MRPPKLRNTTSQGRRSLWGLHVCPLKLRNEVYACCCCCARIVQGCLEDTHFKISRFLLNKIFCSSSIAIGYSFFSLLSMQIPKMNIHNKPKLCRYVGPRLSRYLGLEKVPDNWKKNPNPRLSGSRYCEDLLVKSPHNQITWNFW